MSIPKTPPTDQVKRIIFNGMKQVSPMLRPSDITVNEQHYQSSLATTREMMMQVKSGSPAVNDQYATHIDIRGVDVKRLAVLREIMESLTETAVSYSDKGISFVGTAKGLCELIDVPEFHRCVKAEIEPMGPTK